jgi:SAM-dependent methyltransferase
MDTKEFKCRACGSSHYHMLLNMGDVPLANAFVKDEQGIEDKSRWPLSLVMCSSSSCRLLQIRDDVPREKLFSDYLWVTSTSAGAKDHAEWLSKQLWDKFGSTNRSPFLVEIASNDGFFLEHYKDVGFKITGVDPSNLADEADARGLTTIRDFFGESVANRIVVSNGKADLIVARNVLGHSSQMRDLVAGMKELLAEDGTLILEVPYAFMLRDETQYDTIFHEHPSYLTIGSIHNLFKNFELKITDIQYVNMNGGSVICEIKHSGNLVSANDNISLAFEQFIGLNEPIGWERFSQDVQRQKSLLIEMLTNLKAEGKRVVAYGAAAKFMTMLNYCGVDSDLIEAVGDANPRKQKLLCPGVRIPVVSPRELMDMKPDYVLIGAWNFKKEIIEFLKNEFKYDKSFIVPLPIPEIIK